MATGYRYELEIDDGRVGIFTGQDKILRYLESENKITREQSFRIKDSIYHSVDDDMFDWLYCPETSINVKYFFTELGDKLITKYISHLKDKVKEIGVKVVRTIEELPRDIIVYEDEHQYAIKFKEN